MDKRLILVALLLCVVCGRAGQATNVLQFVGVTLSQEALEDIDETDCSTPQRSFLGFVKGMVAGDFNAYFRHLADDARVAEFGTTVLSDVAPATTNAFHQAVVEMDFTDHAILSYSEDPSASLCRIDATMQSRKGPMVKRSFLEIQMANVEGEWRISSWDVDE